MKVIVKPDGRILIQGAAEKASDMAVVNLLKKWLKQNPKLQFTEGEVENHKLLSATEHAAVHSHE